LGSVIREDVGSLVTNMLALSRPGIPFINFTKHQISTNTIYRRLFDALDVCSKPPHEAITIKPDGNRRN
jgi:hypothetical protein